MTIVITSCSDASVYSGGSRTISQVKEFVGQEREVAIKAMNPLQ
ncbi:MAG TPA: hypothetical protein VI754_01860 [Bacteriovoracaceae bacterium]|nr:hypothetical protein [Bacteriovoracaceae bacterium]